MSCCNSRRAAHKSSCHEKLDFLHLYHPLVASVTLGGSTLWVDNIGKNDDVGKKRSGCLPEVRVICEVDQSAEPALSALSALSEVAII